MDSELPLPEFAELEHVPTPNKPRYRISLTVEIQYEDDVEFMTDEDPEEYLEDEEIAADLVTEVIDGGTDWGPSPRWGVLQVTYDNGVSWETYKKPEPAREW